MATPGRSLQSILSCFVDDVTKIRVWQKDLLFRYFFGRKNEKLKKENITRPFSKLTYIQLEGIR
jgi:hypothetical protein